ncbi:MAG: hypothetical protein CMJ32_11250 [Phycisphaerae bacterium]|nr:hypothetical protein [Phycisphaerae bacterium]
MLDTNSITIYKDDGDRLMEVTPTSSRVVILPSGDLKKVQEERRIRIQWGQHLLQDLIEGRYRTIICGVNDIDNSHGILGELLQLVPTSQWTLDSVTSYARMFRSAVNVHAAEDREPYILKFDLDRILILGMLRPAERDSFTLEDIHRGFSTISKMLDGRRDRQPCASVSFLGAKSNRLIDHNGAQPSFEAVLDAMHKGGYSGDVYPAPSMWDLAPTGVFNSYPFPESLDRMREGSS